MTSLNLRHCKGDLGLTQKTERQKVIEKKFRLREIIVEQPEIEAGCDYWLWFNIFRKTYSWILVKFVDIFTDFAAAYQHFKYENYKYGILTLFFVYLPGLVLALGKENKEVHGRKPSL